MINTSRQVVRLNLLSYGEDELAAKTPDLTDDEMVKIGTRAFELTFSIAKGKLYLAVALAAVEIMEDEPRPLKRTRRKLKGVWDQHEHGVSDPHMDKIVRSSPVDTERTW